MEDRANHKTAAVLDQLSVTDEEDEFRDNSLILSGTCCFVFPQ